LQGAIVTAMDLSQGMLDATTRLASRYGVQVRTHKSAAEDTALEASDLYDVIYAGNLMHHVDIASTLRLLKRQLAPGGQLVTWDPLAYNPVINIYRSIATDVRTTDEHPLKWKDIRLFHREFRSVTTAYFWLTTLLVFVVMAVLQRRDPNKERYWKSVVAEADTWAPLYVPLSRLDALLLRVLPPMRLLCWNVVIVAKDPI
jgi:SAM-dependent methyltransferase